MRTPSILERVFWVGVFGAIGAILLDEEMLKYCGAFGYVFPSFLGKSKTDIIKDVRPASNEENTNIKQKRIPIVEIKNNIESIKMSHEEIEPPLKNNEDLSIIKKTYFNKIYWIFIISSTAYISFSVWPVIKDILSYAVTYSSTTNPKMSIELQQRLIVSRPVIIENFWSQENCLSEKFSGAIDEGIPIPPEIEIYCQFPWKTEFFSKLVSSLDAHNINIADVLFSKSPDPFFKESIAYKALNFNLSHLKEETIPSLEGVYIASKILPFLKVINDRNPELMASVRKLISEEYILTLSDIAKTINWNEVVTQETPRIYKFELKLSERESLDGIKVSFYTDGIKSLNAADFADMIIRRSAKIEKLTGTPVVFDTTWLKKLHLHDGITVGFLEEYIQLLYEYAEHRDGLTRDKLPNWRPISIANPSPHQLEIYYLNQLPDEICGKSIDKQSAIFCQNENRIYALKSASKEEIKEKCSIGPLSLNSINLPQTLYHELAHAFSNPILTETVGADFISEGMATAEGENARRTVQASLNYYCEEPRQALEEFRIFSNFLADLSVMPSVEKNKLEENAKDKISNTDLTSLQKKYLCVLSSKPLDADFIISQLTKSFEDESDTEKTYAYASAWAIFNFTTDVFKDEYQSKSILDNQSLYAISEDLWFGNKSKKFDDYSEQLKKLITIVQSKIIDLKLSKKVGC